MNAACSAATTKTAIAAGIFIASPSDHPEGD
jgi:hypothetical protein